MLPIDQVLSGSPAASGKLRKGDILVTVNGRAIERESDIKLLLHRRNVLSLKRGSRRIELKVRALDIRVEKELIGFLADGDHRFEVFAGCDDDCNCTAKGAMCDAWSTFEGEGPNGGVMITHHCVTTVVDSNTLRSRDLPEKTKGPLEFF